MYWVQTLPSISACAATYPNRLLQRSIIKFVYTNTLNKTGD
jgi:hypothetical protein